MGYLPYLNVASRMAMKLSKGTYSGTRVAGGDGVSTAGCQVLYALANLLTHFSSGVPRVSV